MPCLACGRGFHNECHNIDCNDCHGKKDKLFETLATGTTVVRTGLIGAPVKNPEDVTDKFSTGRKRAAKEYPIFKDEPCEWRLKKNCGGGKHPIVGCLNGFQVDRHHGPVKNTLRNDPHNIHRICKPCHNRWHAANDEDYEQEVNKELPHNPELATIQEVVEADIKWKTGRGNDDRQLL